MEVTAFAPLLVPRHLVTHLTSALLVLPNRQYYFQLGELYRGTDWPASDPAGRSGSARDRDPGRARGGAYRARNQRDRPPDRDQREHDLADPGHARGRWPGRPRPVHRPLPHWHRDRPAGRRGGAGRPLPRPAAPRGP